MRAFFNLHNELFQKKFSDKDFELLAMRLIKIFHKFLNYTFVTSFLEGETLVEEEGIAFDATRLGIDMIAGGYAPSVISTALDAFVSIHINSGKLNDKEIVELCMVKTIIPIMQAGDIVEFSSVLKPFCSTYAVVHGLSDLIYPFNAQ